MLEDLLNTRGAQLRLPPAATEGDEVHLAGLLKLAQPRGHVGDLVTGDDARYVVGECCASRPSGV